MAAGPTPDPTAGGGGPTPAGPPTGGPGGSPNLQAPGTPEMRALATLYQACKQLAQQNPVLSAGLSKAAEGIQEAQTALVTQPKSEAASATPPL